MGLRLKIRMFWELIPTFVELIGKKLVRGKKATILNSVNGSNISSRGSYSNKFFWIEDDCTDNLKRIIEDIMKIVKSIEDSGLLIKGVTETIKNEVKEQKMDILVCYKEH